MRIRTKLLLATVVPLALLIIQIAAINTFIRELQSAVTFISSAHSLIEADFEAAELVDTLRRDVKKLPSRYVSRGGAADDADPMQSSWKDLTNLINLIRLSNATKAVEPVVLEVVMQAFIKATEEYEGTKVIAAGGAADLNTLFERAIFIDKALDGLAKALDTMAVELREELQAAVDDERKIHNRPIQAAVVIGGIAVMLLAGFTWLMAAYVLRPVRDLMEGAVRVAGGNLMQRVPVRSKDEVGVLAQTFNDMAGRLQESFDTLEAQNEELQRLDKLKDEFLANRSSTAPPDRCGSPPRKICH
jgi:HAMP domain-containing protein